MIILRALTFFLFFSILFGQDQIGTDWIDVSGKSKKQIKKIIKDRIESKRNKLRSYTPEIINDEKKKLNTENENRNYDYNSIKISIREELNDISGLKQVADIDLINSKDALNDAYSRLKNQEQIIAYSDSSIINNQQLIEERKKFVEEELSKIPFYEVLVSIAYEYPGSNVKNFDKVMDYQIAKKAIDAKLGTEVIKSSIIDNGIISNEKLRTLLQGKANSDLRTVENIKVDEGTGEIVTDRIRYGLVTVYPFQIDDNSILNSKLPRIKNKIETFLIDDARDYLAKSVSTDINRELIKFEQEAAAKNLESKSIIQRVGREAKVYIDSRVRELELATGNKNQALSLATQINQEINEAISDSTQKAKDQQVQSLAFDKINKQYTYHVFSERHIFVDTRYEQRVENIDMDNQFTSAAFSLYDIFLDNINSQTVKEETTLNNGQLDQFEGTKKEGVRINAIRLLGKSINNSKSTGKLELGISMAFDYGFIFEGIDPNQIDFEPYKPSKKPRRSMPDRIASIKPEPKPVPKPVPKEKPVIMKKQDFNIAINSSPKADVFVSGQKIGMTPLRYYLDPSSPHGIILKKKGYNDVADVVSVSDGNLTTKNYNLVRANKEKNVAKKSSMRKYLLYSILGGGVVYAALNGQNKDEEEKTGSLSISISIPN